MDMSDASFERGFQRFVAACTEDYLIRHSNKGLYNRALKDIDKGVGVRYTWGPSSVSCELSDGTVCMLGAGLEQASCSCPADNLCKHILIAILSYARRQPVLPEQAIENEAEGGAGDESEPAAAKRPSDGSGGSTRFAWLLEPDLARLLKPFSSSVIEEALFRLRYQEEIEVIEESLCTIRLARQEVEVSFKEEPDPAMALCKLKQRAGELAKLEALLRYRLSKGLNDTEALAGKAYPVRLSLETVRECKRILEKLMRTGLARLPQSYAAQLETMAVAAHSGDLPEVERGMRGIQGELELFFKRHVRFSMREMADRVTRLYVALDLLERQPLPAARQSQLVGAFRAKYYAIPRLRLYSLGAEPWETRSGYRGITYYLFSSEDMQLYTYSDARAVFYENNGFSFSQHYRDFSPWLPSLTMQQFAESQLEFHGVKVNAERRLSSGEGAKLALLPRGNIEELDLGGHLQTIPEIRHQQTGQPSLFADPAERLAFIRLRRIAQMAFDTQAQSLLFTVEDEAGELLELRLPYHQEWAKAIKRLESGYRTSGLEGFTAFVRLAGGRAEPISFLKNGKVISLKLDE